MKIREKESNEYRNGKLLWQWKVDESKRKRIKRIRNNRKNRNK